MAKPIITKAAAGYLEATKRDRCGNCRHIEQTYVDRSPPWDRAGWACRLNDFPVTVGAICNAFEAKKTVTPPRFN
jgi:hypothetical protein